MMPAYIDKEYYREQFQGVDIDDNHELERFIKRASDMIDQVTNYKIKDLNILHTFIQELVKKATAAQVEFFELEGGVEIATVGGKLNTVSIGKLSYGEGATSSKNNSRNSKIVPPAVINYLKPTGLLYSGIETAGVPYAYY